MKICEVLVKQNQDLQVLLAVEDNGLGLDLPVLDVDLVASEDDGDVLAHPHQISVPVWHILIRHTGGHVKHDDRALALKKKNIGREY